MSFALILLPLLSLIPFLLETTQENITTTLLIILAIMIVDNGHVFLTTLRLFHYRRTAQEKIRYFCVYFFFLVFTFLWFILKIPYFWSFFLYFTAFHHLRQNLGMGAWLSKAHGPLSQFSRFLFYWIFLVPLLLFHLRPDLGQIGLMPGVYEISTLGVQLPFEIYNALATASLVISFIALAYHFYKTQNHQLSSYLISVFLLNCVCFLYGSNFYEIYIPLVLSHGLTYYLVMIHATKKIFSCKPYFPYIVVIGLGTIAGILDWGLQFDEMYSYHKLNIEWLALLGISLSLSINLSHYLIDGWIWKKTDSEYKQIFN